MPNECQLLQDFGHGRDQPVNELLWCLVFVPAAAARPHIMVRIPWSHTGVVLTALDPLSPVYFSQCPPSSGLCLLGLFCLLPPPPHPHAY